MYKTLEDFIGETPLVRLQRLSAAAHRRAAERGDRYLSTGVFPD